MANKPIGDLPAATTLGNNDLFLIEQNGEAKQMSASKLKESVSQEGMTAAEVDALWDATQAV